MKTEMIECLVESRNRCLKLISEYLPGDSVDGKGKFLSQWQH